MNTYRKLAALTLAAIFSLTAATAQQDKKEKDKTKDKKKHQTITIVRSGDSEEKITVEVTGDKILVNGKPVEEYKGDVEVITGSDNFYVPAMGRLADLKVPGVPMAISGVGGDHFFSWNGNAAVLGVSTENGEGGAKITEVTKESAAEKAGLKVGDIITKVNEFNVADADDLPMAIRKFKADDKVTINYKREGKEQTATATLQKNENNYAVAMADDMNHDFNWNFDDGNGKGTRVFSASRRPKLGLQIEDLEQGNGVKVLDVSAETPAGKAGLLKDDVITSFNGKDIKSVDDIRAAMRDVKEGETIKVTFTRGGSAQSADIRFPKAVKKASL